MNDLCKILNKKEVHQKLIELKEKTIKTKREYAFNVCSNGKTTKIIGGSKKRINLAGINKECNKIYIGVHSHVRGIPYPSILDFNVELYNQPIIANCVYSVETNTITCYRTSDEFRTKYFPPLKKLLDKMIEIQIKYNNSTNQRERQRLYKTFEKEKNKHTYLLYKTQLAIIKSIYPDVSSIHDYYINTWINPKLGDFGNIWIKNCGKLK